MKAMKAVYAVLKKVPVHSDDAAKMGFMTDYQTGFQKVEHYYFEGTREEHEEFQKRLSLIGTPVGQDTLLLGEW